MQRRWRARESAREKEREKSKMLTGTNALLLQVLESPVSLAQRRAMMTRLAKMNADGEETDDQKALEKKQAAMKKQV